MLDFYRITVSKYDANRFLGLQIEADGTFPYVEAVYPLGFVSRPIDAGENEPGCMAIGFEDGSDTYAMPLTDPKVLPLQPQVKGGGLAIFAPNPALQTFLSFDGSNGSITMYAKDGSSAHALNMDINTHAVFLQSAGGASLVLDADNAVLRSPDGSSSLAAANGKAQVFGNLGVTGSISQVGGLPVVLLPQLVAFLQQLISVLAAHETAMALNVPPITPAVLSPTLIPLLPVGSTSVLFK